jgi:hypothetical protein
VDVFTVLSRNKPEKKNKKEKKNKAPLEMSSIEKESIENINGQQASAKAIAINLYNCHRKFTQVESTDSIMDSRVEMEQYIQEINFEINNAILPFNAFSLKRLKINGWQRDEIDVWVEAEINKIDVGTKIENIGFSVLTNVMYQCYDFYMVLFKLTTGHWGDHQK